MIPLNNVSLLGIAGRDSVSMLAVTEFLRRLAANDASADLMYMLG